jgi:NAD(P)-dependent dehydrogenase (short-subunit alcohol dehydrogenase family)
MIAKIAVVTGAGSGIGRAVALALAKVGYTLVVAGRKLPPLEDVVREAGAGAIAVTTDVADRNCVDALFARVTEQWKSVIDTNLTGAFLCTQAAFRLMKSQQPRGGRIINNGSISATTPRPRMVAYTASKHAISGLTKTTSLEGREHDIACGQIDIGNTATALATPMAHGTLQADMSLKPEPTFDVKYVADAVVYMASLPLEANVLFMTVMATKMPFVGRG